MVPGEEELEQSGEVAVSIHISKMRGKVKL